MTEKTQKKKVLALGLCSGGLDSMCSALILRNQGIEVQWIVFVTPFFGPDKAREAAKICKIPLIEKNITQDYLKMLKNPPRGYGQNMNPCLDCHTFMFREAAKIMKEKNFDFLFSGEVLGQRPMSQRKESLRYVELNSGVPGYILRPLSAKLLPVTIPEEREWVNRELLLDIDGRSRKKQFEFIHKQGIHQYATPAGGCLLTDAPFSCRLRDLLNHEDNPSENEMNILKYGRHFRFDTAKIIVGRDQKDNEQLDNHRIVDIHGHIEPCHPLKGPSVLVTPSLSNPPDIEDIMKQAATLCAGYSHVPEGMEAKCFCQKPGTKITEEITVISQHPDKFRSKLIEFKPQPQEKKPKKNQYRYRVKKRKNTDTSENYRVKSTSG